MSDNDNIAAAGETVIETVKEGTAKKKHPGLLSFFIITFIISIVVSCGIVFFYDRYVSVRIVGVDLRGFIEDQRDMYLAGKITDEQLRANLDAMEKKINSMPKNRVMISADMLVGKNAETMKP